MLVFITQPKFGTIDTHNPIFKQNQLMRRTIIKEFSIKLNENNYQNDRIFEAGRF